MTKNKPSIDPATSASSQAAQSIDAPITEKIISSLNSHIDGSWAELYGFAQKDQSLHLLLVVGEPKRRKIAPHQSAIINDLKSATNHTQVSLLILSPEGGLKEKEAKPLYKKQFCLKKF